MNGVMMPSVSAGSSHRDARVTCAPHVMVPSGAALTGLTAPSVRATTSTGRTPRQYGTLMTCPLMDSGQALPGEYLVQAVGTMGRLSSPSVSARSRKSWRRRYGWNATSRFYCDIDPDAQAHRVRPLFGSTTRE